MARGLRVPKGQAGELAARWAYGPDPRKVAGTAEGVVERVQVFSGLGLTNPRTTVRFGDGRTVRLKGAPGGPGPNGRVPEVPVGRRVAITYNAGRWILWVKEAEGVRGD